MWSDKYYYLNILSDESLSKSSKTQDIRNFVKASINLEQTSDFSFRNKSSFPFTDLTLLKVKNLNSWSSKDLDLDETNFITITCVKGNDNEFEMIKSELIRIAQHLNWKLIDEETDNGIENHIIWKP